MTGDRLQRSMQPICNPYARVTDHPCMGFALLPRGLQGAMQGMQGSGSPNARARGKQIHISVRYRVSSMPCMGCIASAKPWESRAKSMQGSRITLAYGLHMPCIAARHAPKSRADV